MERIETEELGMKRHFVIIYMVLALAFCLACSKERSSVPGGKLEINSAIADFVDAESGLPAGDSKVNLSGDAFETGDLIRLKIICPFTDAIQSGESTGGGTYDSFWLLVWNGSGWRALTANDKYDVNWNYDYSGSSNIFGVYEAQATPYVYTASTWTEEKLMSLPNPNAGGTPYMVDHYSHVFHHDQSRVKNYKASDLLWAQQYSQTGSWNLQLNFSHVLCCLEISVDDSAGTSVSDDAVMTIEGMPDIDQKEIIVGDYYARRSKINHWFCYQQRSSCLYENNGKVMGVLTFNEQAWKAVVRPFTGSPEDPGFGADYRGSVIPNTGTYTCLNMSKAGGESGVYRVIVPPCILASNPKIYLRDDDRRWNMEIDLGNFPQGFEQGKLYRLKMLIPGPENNEEE